MDALPIVEETGLPYASAVRAKGPAGESVGVMHACGHDLHTAHLVAIGELFAALEGAWRGTLILVAQPAEEIGRGALAMLEDGFAERFPHPDVTLAPHVVAALPAGRLGLAPGWTGANVDAVDIAIFGRGGHGARPHEAVDPVVAAAQLVTALQTIVSRRVDPQQAAVVTVGSIHGGSRHNVIPDRVDLQLTVRSYTDEVRSLLLASIEQLARDTCDAFGCPRPPEVRVRQNYTPAVYNDPSLARRAASVFASVVGEDQVVPWPPSMGGDDFGRFGRAFGVPSLLYRLGATEPARWEAAQEPGAALLPTLHSSAFAPDSERTLATGVRATASLMLDLFERPLQGAPSGKP
jgi:hippurate hydrolase